MTSRDMISYAYQPAMIKPYLLDAVFRRVQSGESFSPLDLSKAYRDADTAAMREAIKATWGEEATLKAYENGASLADISRIMLALRQSGAIVQDFTAAKGRVLWKLDIYHANVLTIQNRLAHARVMLEATPADAKIPAQDFNALEPHVIAHAEKYGVMEPFSYDTARTPQESYFREINATLAQVDAPRRPRGFFGRIASTVKDYVGETIETLTFRLTGKADLPVTEIMKASPEDKLRWANLHAPGEDVPIENRKNYYRPNLRPSIILRIPVG
ncbi:hypothetical protein HOU00_gp056 [Caulobacter phage CcrPW]|uniref:Uncharacterized protein n=1 Tax=Caulobacter phage CcrPW TaxID=2283271 RepID=A0A385EC66_9CAUD|nr:hypothetical protein HOU00_gp056 [Caulobacter phage CcrPW]AXQ68595.1 hypothetical protein CcrPW_gp056 [Caulobacter phage CcrPW]